MTQKIIYTSRMQGNDLLDNQRFLIKPDWEWKCVETDVTSRYKKITIDFWTRSICKPPCFINENTKRLKVIVAIANCNNLNDCKTDAVKWKPILKQTKPTLLTNKNCKQKYATHAKCGKIGFSSGRVIVNVRITRITHSACVQSL